MRALGHGAFSNVWLAEDASIPPLSVQARVGAHPTGASVAGTSPVVDALDDLDILTTFVDANLGLDLPTEDGREGTRLVAVKTTPRVCYHDRERIRVGFIREVEVLRVRHCPLCLPFGVLIIEL